MPEEKRLDLRPPKGSRYAPIGAWGFVGSFLLMSIPVVGTILTIVWACGGAHNQNRRGLARASLLMLLLLAILYAVLYFGFGFSLEQLGQMTNV